MAQPTIQQVRDANLAIRQKILEVAQPMRQQIFSQTITSSAIGSVVNVPFRNVGLIRRFWVMIALRATLGGAETQTLTAYGPGNVLSNVTLTDLANQTRINTAGLHLATIAGAKNRGPFGAAYTTDTPLGWGDVYSNVMAAPASYNSAQASNNVFMTYEVPCAYSDLDLRGAIYSNVVNATGNLQLTINPQFFVATGVDATLAVYQSSSATLGTMPSITITVYQEYWDQLPTQNGAILLPPIDISTQYQMTNTAFSGLTVAQNFPIPYANFRDFVSTIVVYDNAGTLNAGTDITENSLVTANTTQIWRQTPDVQSMLTRISLGDDVPKGMQYFPSRDKPINTSQYGNMNLNLMPSSVTAGASLLVYWEYMAMAQIINQAGSLPGG